MISMQAYDQTGAPRAAIQLSEYAPPPWLAPELKLRFDLHPERTRVGAIARFERNPVVSGQHPLVLDGESMRLIELALDGRVLGADEYSIDESAHTLTLVGDLPDSFELRVETEIAPAKNTALEGLYMSGGKFCTQCEAQGFRRIVYFLDRPDVMSRYTTEVVGPKDGFPILLSNGNPMERKDLGDGRHSVTWEDPFPKPTYLFALVAGDLGLVKDSFRTASGRDVALELYVDHGNEDRAGFAMQSLKDAMAWDEQTFGLEYDLDIYMIVAVDDFNMGAMENKGLNLFNSKLVLANPRTATDDAFEFIQAVIGHEYFHNWTGNRVTCRDWFQLTLKEGLTVYRDQRFTEDMTHAAIKRIKDVVHLRVHQFPEDAGPMSHPIQPKSYIEINNFYTMTVYEKGAEIIRMIATLIGRDAFRRGMDVYFERNDGQAVTTEEFVAAMEAGSGRDLSQFRRWYDQNGTPELVVLGEEYDAAAQEYRLKVAQSNPVYAKQAEGQSAPGAAGENAGGEPLLIPLRIGLLGADGHDLPLSLSGHMPIAGVDSPDTVTVPFAETEQTLVFQNITEAPVLSTLRGFSAPVHLKFEKERDRKDLAFLFAHDSDLFSRWEAGQSLMRAAVDDLLAALAKAGDAAVDTAVARPVETDALLPGEATDALLREAFQKLLNADGLDPAYLSLALQLPSEAELSSTQNPAQIRATHIARRSIRRTLAAENRDRLLSIYRELHASSELEGNSRRAVGERRLKNCVLGYLMSLGDAELESLCFAQQRDARTMTDETAALYLLSEGDAAEREESLALFQERWQQDALVIDHWFSAQALSARLDTPAAVRALQNDAQFSLKNPNKVRALFGAFSRNGLRFHSADGYALLADTIAELDAINPGIAARLARGFNEVGRLQPELRSAARENLERILALPKLSNDVYEIASRSLRFAT